MNAGDDVCKTWVCEQWVCARVCVCTIETIESRVLKLLFLLVRNNWIKIERGNAIRTVSVARVRWQCTLHTQSEWARCDLFALFGDHRYYSICKYAMRYSSRYSVLTLTNSGHFTYSIECEVRARVSSKMKTNWTEPNRHVQYGLSEAQHYRRKNKYTNEIVCTLWVAHASRAPHIPHSPIEYNVNK